MHVACPDEGFHKVPRLFCIQGLVCGESELPLLGVPSNKIADVGVNSSAMTHMRRHIPALFKRHISDEKGVRSDKFFGDLFGRENHRLNGVELPPYTIPSRGPKSGSFFGESHGSALADCAPTNLEIADLEGTARSKAFGLLSIPFFQFRNGCLFLPGNSPEGVALADGVGAIAVFPWRKLSPFALLLSLFSALFSLAGLLFDRAFGTLLVLCCPNSERPPWPQNGRLELVPLHDFGHRATIVLGQTREGVSRFNGVGDGFGRGLCAGDLRAEPAQKKDEVEKWMCSWANHSIGGGTRCKEGSSSIFANGRMGPPLILTQNPNREYHKRVQKRSETMRIGNCIVVVSLLGMVCVMGCLAGEGSSDPLLGEGTGSAADESTSSDAVESLGSSVADGIEGDEAGGPTCVAPTEGLGSEPGKYLDMSLAMKDCAGNSVSLLDVACGAKAVLVDIGAQWCDPCKKEAEHLEEDAVQKYKDDGLVVISVITQDSDGNPATATTCEWWKNEFGLTSPVVTDPLGNTNFLVGGDASSSMPVNILLDKDFKIVSFTTGGLSVGDLQDKIESALEQ